MAILIGSFLVFLAMIFALALGILQGKPAIKGSCGGVAGHCPKAGRYRIDCMAGCQRQHEQSNSHAVKTERIS